MRRGRENRVGNRFQSVGSEWVCAFQAGGLKPFKSRFLVVSGRSKASGTWAPRGPPSLPRSTCSLIPQPLKWRKKEEMWAGPLVGGDGKNRGKNELELGRKRFFPSGSCFLVCKIGVCCQCILSGAGWEKQLLGTGVVMGDGVSSAWLLGAVCRSDWQNTLQSYAASLHFLPWEKLVFFLKTVAWALCSSLLFTQGRRLDWKKEARDPRREASTCTAPTGKPFPHWLLTCLHVV